MNPHTQGEGHGSRQTDPGKKGKNNFSCSGHNQSKKQIQSYYLKSTLMRAPYNYIGALQQY